MMEKEQGVEGKVYLNQLYRSIKKMQAISEINQNLRFSVTEMRFLGEIIHAKYAGKRLISTQIAKNLGITRSAISQIVNRLVADGVVKRVADDVDRKIAYIELTEDAMESYLADLKIYEPFIERVVEKFGADRFQQLCDLMDAFYDLIKEEKNTL